MKDLGKKIDVLTKDILPDLIQLRRHLHAHPELSGQEYQTAALVAGELRKSGWEVKEAVGKTGVVAEMGNKADLLLAYELIWMLCQLRREQV